MKKLKIFLIILTFYFCYSINAVNSVQFTHKTLIGHWETQVIKPNNLLLWFVKTIKISFYKQNKYKATIHFPLGITKHLTGKYYFSDKNVKLTFDGFSTVEKLTYYFVNINVANVTISDNSFASFIRCKKS
ncbi:MAG: hypothetical protein GY756_28020 [bacterium]|nr:hypothetical protein [bacterium]